MAKIMMNIEFHSFQELKDFLGSPQATETPAQTAPGPAPKTQPERSPNTPGHPAAPKPEEPPPAPQPQPGPAPDAPAALLTPSSNQSSGTPPANPSSGATLTGVDPRAALNAAAQDYLNRGNDVVKARDLMMEVAGVGKKKDVPDDKIVAMIEAFKTR